MKSSSTSELQILQCIDEAFEQAIPIIHKESEYDYSIVLITHCGLRIKERVHSEQAARKVVNKMIANKKISSDSSVTG